MVVAVEGNSIQKLTGRARNPIILAAFNDYLLLGRSFSAHTLESYSTQILRFEKFLASRRKSFLQAKRKDVKDFLKYRRSAGVAERSLAQLVSALRHFYRFLVSRNYSRRSPLLRIGCPTQWKGLPTTVNQNEIEVIANSKKPAGGKPVDQAMGGRDRAIIEVLYGAALRVSELLALKLEDVNLQARPGFLLIHGKGRRDRICILGERAASALQDYLAKWRQLLETTHSGSVLFLGRHGAPLTRQRVWQVVTSASPGTGSHVTPNTLRQSRAAHMVENGADLEEVQRLLGYSDIKNAKIHALTGDASPREQHRTYQSRRRSKAPSN